MLHSSLAATRLQAYRGLLIIPDIPLFQQLRLGLGIGSVIMGPDGQLYQRDVGIMRSWNNDMAQDEETKGWLTFVAATQIHNSKF